ncbi:hypothetical protein [Paenibacillus alba]|nr:hypothetical protein [Paenibacillus alba]
MIGIVEVQKSKMIFWKTIFVLVQALIPRHRGTFQKHKKAIPDLQPAG